MTMTEERREHIDKMTDLWIRKHEITRMMVEIDEQIMTVMHSVGCEDEDIAEDLGLKVNQVVRWRREHELKSNRVNRFEKRNKKRRKDYDEGYTDAELSEMWGIKRASVMLWRQKYELPPNRPSKKRRIKDAY